MRIIKVPRHLIDPSAMLIEIKGIRLLFCDTSTF
jgi:hypothetical protein